MGLTAARVNDRRIEVYRALFRSLGTASGPDQRRPYLKRIAAALAHDSWSPAGITLHIERRTISLSGHDPESPTLRERLPDPGWRLPKSGERTVDIDCVAPFRLELAPLVEILEELEDGRLPMPTPIAEGEAPNDGRFPYIHILGKSVREGVSNGREIPLEEWRARLTLASPKNVPGIIQDFQESVCRRYAGKEYLGEFVLPMMTLARKLGEGRDVETAVAVWRSLLEQHEIIGSSVEDGAGSIVRSMLNFAHIVSDLEKPKTNRDFDTALRIWTLLLDMSEVIDQIKPDNTKHVISIMLKVAHQASDLEMPPEQRDFDVAIRIWCALVERREIINRTEADNTNGIIRTMLKVGAQARQAASTGNGNLMVSVQISFALIRMVKFLDQEDPSFLDSAVRDLHRVAKMNPAHLRPVVLEFRSGNALLDGHVRSMLHYVLSEFAECVQYIDSFPTEHPLLLSVKAQALRKLKRYEAAEEAAVRVLVLTHEKKGYWTGYCRAKAHNCLGNIFVETGQNREAYEQYVLSADVARRYRLLNAPRMLMRLAVKENSRGRREEAIGLAREALTIDPRNTLATQFLARYGSGA